MPAKKGYAKKAVTKKPAKKMPKEPSMTETKKKRHGMRKQARGR